MKWFLETKNIDYDVQDSLAHFKWNNFVDIRKRAEDLMIIKANPSFISLVTSFKRISNIIDKYECNMDVVKEKFEIKAEIDLYEAFENLKKNIEPLIENKNYLQALESLKQLGKEIDLFFDDVLVICDDINLRNNRLNLLKNIHSLFVRIADINKINTEIK
jgi:glycyl-tRNA synthetase beta chain